MRFGLLYEIAVPPQWGEDAVANRFWEALEQVKVAQAAGFTHVFADRDPRHVLDHRGSPAQTASSATAITRAASHTRDAAIGGQR